MYNKQILSRMELLDIWIAEIASSDKIHINKFTGESSSTGYRYFKQLFIYTDKYKYCITCVDDSGNAGYLGCGTSLRRPLAGEDWVRGNDLCDGPFFYNTWCKIKNNIIKNELLKTNNYTCRNCSDECDCDKEELKTKWVPDV